MKNLKGYAMAFFVAAFAVLSLVGLIVFLVIRDGETKPEASTISFGDDFGGSSLNPIWQFDNPSGSASYQVNGDNLKLNVATGDDQWIGVDRAPRVLKVQNGTTWSIETKITGSTAAAASLTGLVVYKDSQNWFIFGQLANLKMEASGIIANTFTNPVGVMDSRYTHLRIRRVASSYFFDASSDGVNWTNVNSWTDSASRLDGAKIGFMGKNWAGNPAYSVQFDYFREYSQDLMPSAISAVESTNLIAKEIGAGGINNTTAVDVCGADLGSMFDFLGKVYIAFGDTSKCPLSGANIDRSSTLAFTNDLNLTDGLNFTDWVESAGRAKELFGDDPGVITSIPTHGVGIGSTAYLFYMQVTNWNPWTCNGSSIATSADGVNWTKKNTTISWGQGNFNQVAIVYESPYVYIWGIPCGRNGSVKLMRVNEANILSKNLYEYFAGFDTAGNPLWNINSEASAVAVAGGPAGEISVIFDPWLGRYIMTYLEDYSGKLVIREALKPWGAWSAPQVLATGSQYPALYGAYLKKDYWENNGETIYFRMSRFFPEYSTYWMKAKLVKNAPVSIPTNAYRAEYFDNSDFTGKVLEREEDKAKLGGRLDTTPVAELASDNSYSIRWEGNFDIAAGKYRFNANPSLDSIKVYVDDNLLVEGSMQQNALVNLTAGVHKLKFEYVRSRTDRNFSLLTNYVDAVSCFDMTGDFKINSADQLALVNHFGATGDTPWDLTGDGRVNSGDQLLLAQNFGKTCP